MASLFPSKERCVKYQEIVSDHCYNKEMWYVSKVWLKNNSHNYTKFRCVLPCLKIKKKFQTYSEAFEVEFGN